MPQEPEFHNNLGLALLAADRVDEAIAAYRRALALKPGHAAPWNNLGLALQAANDLPGAIAAYPRGARAAPDFAQAHWNLGLALLAHGEFAEGWREYDWRLAHRRTRAAGTAAGEPALGRRATRPAGRSCSTAEQGLGDALQFIRFARAAGGARRARAGRRRRRHSRGCSRPRPASRRRAGRTTRCPPHDLHLPLLSLAGVARRRADDDPGRRALPPAPTPQQAAAIAAGAPAACRPSLRVGLVVGGQAAATATIAAGRARSRRWRRCSSCPASRGSRCRRDDGEDQLPGVPAARAMVLLDARRDFDRKAALVAALDLVISVDTSIAHLAGALARPVWVLLPFAPDWRWQLDRTDSPWYPTARLFRQRRTGTGPRRSTRCDRRSRRWSRDRR